MLCSVFISDRDKSIYIFFLLEQGTGLAAMKTSGATGKQYSRKSDIPTIKTPSPRRCYRVHVVIEMVEFKHYTFLLNFVFKS